MNAQQSLEHMAETARVLEIDAHMNLISKDVSVFAVPGFENKLLKQVSQNDSISWPKRPTGSCSNQWKPLKASMAPGVSARSACCRRMSSNMTYVALRSRHTAAYR
jgi:hypothetical protein